MTLTELAEKLRSQATQGSSIVLNEDVLGEKQVDGIRTAFQLGPTEYLTVSGLTAGAIPQPSNGELRICGGAVGLFAQGETRPELELDSLVFALDDCDAEQIVIDFGLQAPWSFRDSFPDLNIFPFDTIEVTRPHFVYAVDQKDYRPWDGTPGQGQQADNLPVDLAPGLNFAAWMPLASLSQATSWLAGLLGDATTCPLCGPFALKPKLPYPVTTLKARLGAVELPLRDAFSQLRNAVVSSQLIFEIGEPVDCLQDIGLRLAVYTQDLELSVGIMLGAPSLSFRIIPIDESHPFTIDKIPQLLPGDLALDGCIPPDVKPVFQGCELAHCVIALAEDNTTVGYLRLAIGSTRGATWNLIPGHLALQDIVLDLTVFSPFDPQNRSISVALRATGDLRRDVFKGGAFEFDIAVSGKDKELAISANYYGSVKLGDLAKGLASRDVPAELQGISFSDFGASFRKTGDIYDYALHARCDALFPLLDTQVVSSLSVALNRKGDTFELDVRGALAIGHQDFWLTLDLAKTEKTPVLKLTAGWQATGQDYLQLRDMAETLGFAGDEIADIPQEFDLALASAALAYDSGLRQLTIGLRSANYGSAVFVAVKPKEKWQFFFGIALPNIDLSRLPLVPGVLPANTKLEIDGIRIAVSSAAIDGTLAGELNKAIGALAPPSGPAPAGGEPAARSYPQVPDADGARPAKGLNLSLTLALASLSIPIAYPGGNSKADEDAALAKGESAALVEAKPADGTTSTVKWIDVNKVLGPLTLQKVALSYAKATDGGAGRVTIGFSAALALSGFGLDVQGLAVSFPLPPAQPADITFELQGLGLYLRRGDLEIAGAFLKRSDYEYGGKAILRTKTLSLSAMGLYACKPNEQPSVFLYAYLGYPLGGPPAFFVTGLAAGFGYNFTLVMPAIDKVKEFPLVAQVMNNKPAAVKDDDLSAALQELADYVPVAKGKYFVVAGVKFTSFKMIESFVMLAVKFGGGLEINVVGFSIIQLPFSSAGSGPSLAFIEIALTATFRPDVGLLDVRAGLTKASYILSKECHPTGELAFRSWFVGKHAGEFVLTVGGYHPAFRVPAHYPQAGRLGISWNVSSALSIKGSAYFALTPSAIMAGIDLQATFSSGPLSAWYRVSLDFIMFWKPFWYDLTAYVNVGVALAIKIDTIFGSFGVTLGASIGAWLHIWGPEFSGTAHIKVAFIEFDVAFGNAQKPERLDWPEFKASLLPENVLAMAVTGGLMVKPPPKEEAATSKGERKSAIDLGTINPYEFALTIDSAIPIRNLNGEPPRGAGSLPAIGIAPMNCAGLESNLVITLECLDDPERDCSAFHITPVVKNVPLALWGTQQNADINAEPKVTKAITGFQIRPGAPDESAEVAGKGLASRGGRAEAAMPAPAEVRQLGVQWETGLRKKARALSADARARAKGEGPSQPDAAMLKRLAELAGLDEALIDA